MDPEAAATEPAPPPPPLAQSEPAQSQPAAVQSEFIPALAPAPAPIDASAPAPAQAPAAHVQQEPHEQVAQVQAPQPAAQPPAPGQPAAAQAVQSPNGTPRTQFLTAEDAAVSLLALRMPTGTSSGGGGSATAGHDATTATAAAPHPTEEHQHAASRLRTTSAPSTSQWTGGSGGPGFFTVAPANTALDLAPAKSDPAPVERTGRKGSRPVKRPARYLSPDGATSVLPGGLGAAPHTVAVAEASGNPWVLRVDDQDAEAVNEEEEEYDPNRPGSADGEDDEDDYGGDHGDDGGAPGFRARGYHRHEYGEDLMAGGGGQERMEGGEAGMGGLGGESDYGADDSTPVKKKRKVTKLMRKPARAQSVAQAAANAALGLPGRGVRGSRGNRTHTVLNASGIAFLTHPYTLAWGFKADDPVRIQLEVDGEVIPRIFDRVLKANWSSHCSLRVNDLGRERLIGRYQRGWRRDDTTGILTLVLSSTDATRLPNPPPPEGVVMPSPAPRKPRAATTSLSGSGPVKKRRLASAAAAPGAPPGHHLPQLLQQHMQMQMQQYPGLPPMPLQLATLGTDPAALQAWLGQMMRSQVAGAAGAPAGGDAGVAAQANPSATFGLPPPVLDASGQPLYNAMTWAALAGGAGPEPVGAATGDGGSAVHPDQAAAQAHVAQAAANVQAAQLQYQASLQQQQAAQAVHQAHHHVGRPPSGKRGRGRTPRGGHRGMPSQGRGRAGAASYAAMPMNYSVGPSTAAALMSAPSHEQWTGSDSKSLDQSSGNFHAPGGATAKQDEGMLPPLQLQHSPAPPPLQANSNDMLAPLQQLQYLQQLPGPTPQQQQQPQQQQPQHTPELNQQHAAAQPQQHPPLTRRPSSSSGGYAVPPSRPTNSNGIRTQHLQSLNQGPLSHPSPNVSQMQHPTLQQYPQPPSAAAAPTALPIMSEPIAGAAARRALQHLAPPAAPSPPVGFTPSSDGHSTNSNSNPPHHHAGSAAAPPPIYAYPAPPTVPTLPSLPPAHVDDTHVNGLAAAPLLVEVGGCEPPAAALNDIDDAAVRGQLQPGGVLPEIEPAQPDNAQQFAAMTRAVSSSLLSVLRALHASRTEFRTLASVLRAIDRPVLCDWVARDYPFLRDAFSEGDGEGVIQSLREGLGLQLSM